MAEPFPQPPTARLVAIASGLGLVTYLESALVEYPLGGVRPLLTMVALGVLLALQVLLAVLLVRSVRRNEDAYSVFFSRATLVALAAVLALTALILLPAGAALVQRELADAAANTAAQTAAQTAAHATILAGWRA